MKGDYYRLVWIFGGFYSTEATNQGRRLFGIRLMSSSYLDLANQDYDLAPDSFEKNGLLSLKNGCVFVFCAVVVDGYLMRRG